MRGATMNLDRAVLALAGTMTLVGVLLAVSAGREPARA